MTLELPTEEEILKSMVFEELCRDDFIEWILRNTNEDSEFRVYKTKHNITIGVDITPFKER